MFWKRNPSGAYEFLIVGLGNPGSRYETTRHNAGFLCVTLLENEWHIKVNKLKFHALVGDATVGGHRVLVMKPQTMMNNSGAAVGECAKFYKIPPEHVIVISDDISLDPGRLRIRRSGNVGRSERLCAMKPSAYRRKVRSWFRKRGVAMCDQWLRHTWGTLALQAGTPLETVSLMLGHSSVSMAYEHYLCGNSALLRDAQRGYSQLLLAS